RVGGLQVEPQRLATYIADGGGPGRDLPAVVELPADGTGRAWPVQAAILQGEAHRVGLVELGGPVPVAEPLRSGQVRGEAAVQLAVAVRGLLVQEERPGLLVQGGLVQRTGQGGPGGRALEAELGDEPGSLVAVVPV